MGALAPQIDESYLLDLARRLVEIPSVSGAEQPLIDSLEQEFRAFGFHCRRFPIEPGRDNLLVSREPLGTSGSRRAQPRGEHVEAGLSKEGRVLCLNAHADTVPPTGRAQARAQIRDGCLYGLGSCDDKGPLAAMVAALLALKDSHLEGRLDLLVTLEEETLGRGAREVIARGYKCDWAIVAEPTALQIVPAHAGLAFLSLHAVGRACHGATPEKGENAIEKLFYFVQVLRTEVSGKMEPHPLIGPPSLNLGVLRGGDAPNRVAERAEALVDIRVIPPFTTADVVQLVERSLARSEWRGISYELQKAGEALSTPTDGLLVATLKEAAAAVTGSSPSIAGLRAWTEAESFQTGLGIEAVVFGPGSVEHAHTQGEFVPLDELAAAARIYAGCALRLLG
jgi:acetylornithine deacetylase/succinyl-diaminopimelate desuccinylase-like protein